MSTVGIKISPHDVASGADPVRENAAWADFWIERVYDRGGEVTLAQQPRRFEIVEVTVRPDDVASRIDSKRGRAKASRHINDAKFPVPQQKSMRAIGGIVNSHDVAL